VYFFVVEQGEAGFALLTYWMALVSDYVFDNEILLPQAWD